MKEGLLNKLDNIALSCTSNILKLIILIVFIISTTVWVLWRVAVLLYKETKAWKVRKRD